MMKKVLIGLMAILTICSVGCKERRDKAQDILDLKALYVENEEVQYCELKMFYDDVYVIKALDDDGVRYDVYNRQCEYRFTTRDDAAFTAEAWEQYYS